MEPEQKQHSVVDVTGDRSKVQCCKKQYCIGAWNVRSTHQGKLEVVKQEMERVNTDILGIIELNNRMNSVNFQGKPFNFTVMQVYSLTSNAEEAEVEQFFEDLQDFLELTPKKRCPFHYRGLECKSRKSRNTWGNRQIWPWNAE